MRRTGRLAAVPLVVALALACTAPESRWQAGGLYSVWEGEETFGVAKVLAVDESSVSIRWYKESFADRPETISSDELSLGSGEDEVTGFDHLALPYREFALMFPLRVGSESVTDEELEGYVAWKEAGGEAFSFQALAEAVEDEAESDSETAVPAVPVEAAEEEDEAGEGTTNE